MVSETVRKLAAIMFTDMVGYSLLTQHDERLALELLEIQRNIVQPIVPQHQGKVIEVVGDGFFIEFNSALEAARCALHVQTALREYNKTAPPERQILIRIGIHLGDVVMIGERVHGDGVNIAARLEPLAAPGGVCMSEDVARQIQNKIETPIVKLGKGQLKNIDLPVHIYRMVLPWEDKQSTLGDRIAFLLKTRKKKTGSMLLALSILVIVVLLIVTRDEEVKYDSNAIRVAVMPFANFSGEQSEEYFADGIMEEVISSLSRISGLSVIARTSVLKYKDARKDVMEIGRELNVGSILEGSVRTVANKARISVQLVDVATQRSLWSERYDRELKDVFAIQSDIAMRVADALRIRLLSHEERNLSRRGTTNQEAYRSYLLGRFELNKRIGTSIQSSIEHFKNSVALDPSYAEPYAGLAEAYTFVAGGYSSLERELAIDEAKKNAEKAIALNSSLAEAHTALGYVKFRLELKWNDAEYYLRKAIELQPGYARGHEVYALYLSLLGREEESIAAMKRAFELDPLSLSVNTGMARVLQIADRTEEAISQIEKTIRLDSTYAEAVFVLGMIHMANNDHSRAVPVLEKAYRLSGGRLMIRSVLMAAYIYAGQSDKAKRMYDELVAESKQKPIESYYFLMYHLAKGNYDEVFRIVDKAIEERSGFLIFMNIDPLFKQARNDPRYLAVKKKLGFE